MSCLFIARQSARLIQVGLRACVSNIHHTSCGQIYRKSPYQPPGSTSLSPMIATLQSRTFIFSSKSDFRPFNKEDNVARHYRLIYSARLKNQIFITYGMILASLVPVFINSITILYGNWSNLTEVLSTMGNMELIPIIGAPFGLFLLIGYQFIFSRMLIRVYYSDESDKLSAIKYNGLFQKEKLDFDPSEVEEAKVDGTFMVRGRRYHVKPEDFRSPTYFNYLMGFVPKRDGQNQ